LAARFYNIGLTAVSVLGYVSNFSNYLGEPELGPIQGWHKRKKE